MRTISQILEQTKSNILSKVLSKRESLSEMAHLDGTTQNPNGDESFIEQMAHHIFGPGDFVEKMKNALADKNHPLHPSNYRHDGAESLAESHDLLTEKKKKSDVTDPKKYIQSAMALTYALGDLKKSNKKLGDVMSKPGSRAPKVGNTGTKVRPEYAELGGKNRTSRADHHIVDTFGKVHGRISVKKGNAQLASAEGGEFRAMAHTATDNYTKDENVRKDIKSRVDKMSEIQKKAADAKGPEDHKKNIAELNRHWTKLRTDHTELEHHIAREAATGDGKFGKGKDGSADHLLTWNHKTQTTKIWSADSGERVPVKKMEFRMGKGKTGSSKNPKERRQRDYAFRVDV